MVVGESLDSAVPNGITVAEEVVGKVQKVGDYVRR
jgi:hypothetical protein